MELDEWWRERGLAREARLWLYRLFEKLGSTGEEIPAAELAVAYHVYARHAGADGELGEQLRLLVQAEEAAWRSGQARMIARVSAGRGEALVALGREEEAERACRDVIDWARSRHVAAEALPAVFCLAQLLWRRGKLAEAATELGAARAVASTHPDRAGPAQHRHAAGHGRPVPRRPDRRPRPPRRGAAVPDGARLPLGRDARR